MGVAVTVLRGWDPSTVWTLPCVVRDAQLRAHVFNGFDCRTPDKTDAQRMCIVVPGPCLGLKLPPCISLVTRSFEFLGQPRKKKRKEKKMGQKYSRYWLPLRLLTMAVTVPWARVHRMLLELRPELEQDLVCETCSDLAHRLELLAIGVVARQQVGTVLSYKKGQKIKIK